MCEIYKYFDEIMQFIPCVILVLTSFFALLSRQCLEDDARMTYSTCALIQNNITAPTMINISNNDLYFLTN